MGIPSPPPPFCSDLERIQWTIDTAKDEHRLVRFVRWGNMSALQSRISNHIFKGHYGEFKNTFGNDMHFLYPIWL